MPSFYNRTSTERQGMVNFSGLKNLLYIFWIWPKVGAQQRTPLMKTALRRQALFLFLFALALGGAVECRAILYLCHQHRRGAAERGSLDRPGILQ
jgi:hypothetical protein